ncbi:MAG: hypothetical protein NUV67_06395, partial [archaeon]|nr:hypothetical protein [archaeon]
PETDEFLMKAKDALEEKSYLEAIFYSQKIPAAQTGLFALTPGLEIPFAIYPLAGVIIGVAYYVHRKSEEEKKPKPKIIVKGID